MTTSTDHGTQVLQIMNEEDEYEALATFGEIVRHEEVALVGFNNLKYDLPVALRRAQIFGLHIPLDLQRYRSTRVIDVYQALTWNELVKGHSQKFYARLFEVPVATSVVEGSDIARLYRAGAYDAIADHCVEDVALTVALAERLRLVSPTRPALFFDIETVAIDEAEALLEPVTAPGNYKDPVKIADYIAEKRRELVERAALDIDLARIVCLGMRLQGELRVAAPARSEPF